jgi:hypothetical protein
MSNKGKGGLSARDWACALCAVLCCAVLVFVFVSLVLARISDSCHPSRANSLEWPSTGPVRQLCARTDWAGSHSRPKLRSKRFENKFGREWAWNRPPAGRPGYPHGAERLSSAPGSFTSCAADRAAQSVAQLPSPPKLLHDRPGPQHNGTPIRPGTAAASPAGLCNPAER